MMKRYSWRKYFPLLIVLLISVGLWANPESSLAEPKNDSSNPSVNRELRKNVQTPLIVVFDTSGSMGDKDATGKVKMDSAKDAMNKVLQNGRMKAALWTYPGGKNDANNCAAGSWVPGSSWADEVNATKVNADIRMLKPSGETPTGPALQRVASLIGPDANAEIILVTDGHSNCGPPPCEIVKDLVKKGYKIQVNPVGFDINGETAEELKCIAKETNGQYVQADNNADIAGFFERFSKDPFEFKVAAPVEAQVNASFLITASIQNNLPDRSLENARINLTFTDKNKSVAYPIPAPQRLLPTINGNSTTTVSWLISTTGNSGEVEWAISAGATNVEAKIIKSKIKISDKSRNIAHASDLNPIKPVNGAIAVLGDEYSAGTGIKAKDNDGKENPCQKATNSIYARKLFGEKVEIGNLACKGASIINLEYPQNIKTSDANGGNITESKIKSQLDQLRDFANEQDSKSGVNAVLMTIGSNDVGIPRLLDTCMTKDCSLSNNQSPLSSDAMRSIKMTNSLFNSDAYQEKNQEKLFGDYTMAPGIGNLPRIYAEINNIINSPARVKKRGSVAPIIISAYPVAVHQTQRGHCGVNLSGKEVEAIWNVFDALNGVIKNSADQIRKDWNIPVYFYEDNKILAQPGHTICNYKESFFVAPEKGNPIRDKASSTIFNNQNWSLSFLPNEKGHTNWANNIIAWQPKNDSNTGNNMQPNNINPTNSAIPTSISPTPSGTTQASNSANPDTPPKAPPAGCRWYDALCNGNKPWTITPPWRSSIKVTPKPLPPDGKLPITDSGSFRPGEKITIHVDGLKPGSIADIVMAEPWMQLNSVIVKQDGSTDLDFILPFDIPIGAHSLEIIGTNDNDEDVYSLIDIASKSPVPIWIWVAYVIVWILCITAFIMIYRSRKYLR